MTLSLRLPIAACAVFLVHAPSGLAGAWRSTLGRDPALFAPGMLDDRRSTPVVSAPIDGHEPAEIGQPRPALELDAADGTLINDTRVAGRLLIVDFFATWCEPCHQALADLTAAQDAVGPNTTLVLVNLGETPSIVRRWAASTRLPPDALVTLDPRGIAARRWGVRRLPTTFVVDANGVVRHINRGWGPGYRDRMLRWLRNAATAPSPSPSPASKPPS